MITGLAKKIFGSRNERELKRLRPLVLRVNELEPSIQKLSSEDLVKKTIEFKERLAKGETLNQIMPEAFAVCRETAKRVLNMRHFDVQLIGGAVLHEGKIAEMRTGEGKTLVATLPVYLNALAGKGVHVVTVNDYLARRDSDWMGQIYRALGLTVGVIVHGLNDNERRENYAADVTYGTNNEFGFDYLRDNMKFRLEDFVQRPLNFAIVDEVDSILIDEARTPLIISGPTEESTDKYYRINSIIPVLKKKRDPLFDDLDEKESELERESAADVNLPDEEKIEREQARAERLERIRDEREKRQKEKVKLLKEKEQKGESVEEQGDYTVDLKAKSAALTEEGIHKVEQVLRVSNLYAPENMELVHHVHQALKAHALFRRDVDYVVKDGEVIIVDEFTGRLMPGRRYSDGLHQALEAKEGVTIENENQTLATITFQNYFRMYHKLAGMTGTADTEAAEFQSIYNLEVLMIPTNRSMVRKDLADIVYKTEKGKFVAVGDEIDKLHQDGRPVLVGTVSIEKSEQLSMLLKKRGVKHNVLNAKHHEREAEIISQAGHEGAVTIATNMAGRGTDIVLGEGVAAKGGLHIIGTERHESRRIDNQLRGRAARQGDPGSTRFYLSLEDNLLKIFQGEKIKALMERWNFQDDEPIESRLISKAIENAQKKVEAHNFDIRKHLLEYDDVLNKQREVVYELRKLILAGQNTRALIMDIVREQITSLADTYAVSKNTSEWDIYGLIEAVTGLFKVSFGLSAEFITQYNTREILIEELVKRAEARYVERESETSPEMFRHLEYVMYLDTIDKLWKDHLLSMDHLKEGIGLRGYGQKDPLVEYKKEGFALFKMMDEQVKMDVINKLYHIQITHPDQVESLQPKEQEMNFIAGDEDVARAPVTRNDDKVGRNDACPCGSGKKYKKCHGA